jgi:hypothetical protein
LFAEEVEMQELTRLETPGANADRDYELAWA